MGVANLLDDNLVHYLLFQFSGIERKKGKENNRKEKKGKEEVTKINVVWKMSWYLDKVS